MTELEQRQIAYEPEPPKEPAPGAWFRVSTNGKNHWARKITLPNGESFANTDGSIIHVPCGYYVFKNNQGKRPYHSMGTAELFYKNCVVIE